MNELEQSLQLSLFLELEDLPNAISLLEDLERHSPWTAQHSVRVAIIASEIAQRTSLSEVDRKLLIRASLLHDIGKIRVPTEILDSPNTLSGEQRQVLDQHPGVGFEIVREFDVEAARILVGHHEYQERKYPRNRGESTDEHLGQLQMIVALSDAVDAGLSKRPYKNQESTVVVKARLVPYFKTDLIDLALEIRSSFD